MQEPRGASVGPFQVSGIISREDCFRVVSTSDALGDVERAKSFIEKNLRCHLLKTWEMSGGVSIGVITIGCACSFFD